MFYLKEDLLQALQKLGIAKGDTLYITGNLGNLGVIKGLTKTQIINTYYEVLKELVGDTGTLVVPTHSFALCNTDKPFSLSETPSETGPFTEYIRNLPSAFRQNHPFSSCSAIGRNARFICTNNSKHVYGYQSPFDRMLRCNAKFLSLGMPVSRNASIVHHTEFLMGVPYRYSKEFCHPVEVNGQITHHYYYLYVTYMDCDIERDKNQKIFDHFLQTYAIKTQTLGLNSLSLFDMNEFVDSTTKLMAKDIYAWLKQPPKYRPFTR